MFKKSGFVLVVVVVACIFIFSSAAWTSVPKTKSGDKLWETVNENRTCITQVMSITDFNGFNLCWEQVFQTSRGNNVYTVSSGDTMYKIAVGHGIGLWELIKANPHIKNPHQIYAGQTVYIPGTTVVQIPEKSYPASRTQQQPVSENERTAAVDSGQQEKQMEKEVAVLVNQERRQRGLTPLNLSTDLSRIARMKAKDMNDKGYFSHQSPTYGSPFEMLRDHGASYRTAGENIAKGYRDAESVVQGWMSSKGHRENILNPSFDRIGVGIYNEHWVQIFTGN